MQPDTKRSSAATAIPRFSGINAIGIQQVHEWGEWVGFETRNKYQIIDSSGTPLAFAAEQQRGFLGFLFRQFLGHWRKFDVHFFTTSRELFMIAHHPFRFLFRRIELRSANGQALGALQQRFSIFSKRFDVQNPQGMTILEIASPLWTPWTFNFMHAGRRAATLKKKWSGIFSEMFTDKDNFTVSFDDPSLNEAERSLIMASAIFVDLMYFERKARS